MKNQVLSFATAIACLFAACPARAADLLYVSNVYGNIMKFDVSSGDVDTIIRSETNFFSNLGNPQGLAFDNTGGLYVADSQRYAVGQISSWGNGPAGAVFNDSPLSLVFDASNNYYVRGGSTIYKVSSGGTISTIAAGLNSGSGITIDQAGNLYSSSYSDGTIFKITPNGSVTTFATGLNYPGDLTIDSSGNLYSPDADGGRINKIDQNGTVTQFASGLDQGLHGVTFDSQGNLFASSSDFIYKFDPSGTLLTRWGAYGSSFHSIAIQHVNVPEPSTWALGVIAAGTIGVTARHRSHHHA